MPFWRSLHRPGPGEVPAPRQGKGALAPIEASWARDTEFDLSRLAHLRGRMVELGRSCVHPDYRHGGVIMTLWGALADFMVRTRVLGAPAWDPDFNTADLPMLMRIEDLPPRYRKHFLG